MKEKIISIIGGALDYINSSSSQESFSDLPLEKSLFGSDDALLDSISLVILVVELEKQVEEHFDVAIIIADDKAMSQKNSPFKSIETLAAHLQQLIQRKLENE